MNNKINVGCSVCGKDVDVPIKNNTMDTFVFKTHLMTHTFEEVAEGAAEFYCMNQSLSDAIIQRKENE